jgi:UDP-N-acetylmuramoyl-tripeptide--D-alanyl-D-alanine ligase
VTAPLWTVQTIVEATGAVRAGALPDAITGISIDSRSIKAGDAFFAIKGDTLDGHDFVAAALKGGAGLAVVARDSLHRIGHSLPRGDAAFPLPRLRGRVGEGELHGGDSRTGPLPDPPPQAGEGKVGVASRGGHDRWVAADAPLLIVDDVLAALRDLARAARARSQARIVAVTGSVGKTSTKEALALALRSDGETHASTASFNNHWGVPLSLARLPLSARYGVFEIGMNHPGEITPLVRMVRPHIAIVTAIEPVHLEFFDSVAAIADAKAEIFLGIEPDGAAVINRDNPHYERLKRHAREAGVHRVVSFGENARADARLIKCALQADSSTVEAKILGLPVTYKIGAPGRHLVMNSLAVLAAAHLAGADLARAALALAQQAPAAGRGTRITLALPEGPALVIDESYNANPTSMRAALALLGQAQTAPGGRRIAVLGDMLELGRTGEELHAALADSIRDNAVDLVYCAGPLMAALWQALPSAVRGGYASSAAELEPQVVAAVRSGDAIMVKASAGSRMGPIVKALARRYSENPAPAAAQAQG